MTKKTILEKNKIKVIESLDNDNGFYKDKWNNYISKKDNTIRYKLKKICIVRQKKIGFRWIIIVSIYYKDAVKLIDTYNK